MNPCPCGYLGDGRRPCKCNPVAIERYIGKISGPLLDRIGLRVEVPAVPFQELAASADGTSSAVMREQVQEDTRRSTSASEPAAIARGTRRPGRRPGRRGSRGQPPHAQEPWSA